METKLMLTIFNRKGKKIHIFSFASRASLDAYLKARQPQFYQIWAW